MALDMATVNELLRNVIQLPAADFEEFFSKIQLIRSSKSKGDFSDEELKLLDKINSGLPRRQRLRWNYLIARRDSGTIIPAEYEELLQLTETVENFEVKRLQWMSRLAELRGMSLPEVVEFYQIHPLENG
jgi:hypothetical protein